MKKVIAFLSVLLTICLLSGVCCATYQTRSYTLINNILHTEDNPAYFLGESRTLKDNPANQNTGVTIEYYVSDQSFILSGYNDNWEYKRTIWTGIEEDKALLTILALAKSWDIYTRADADRDNEIRIIRDKYRENDIVATDINSLNYLLGYIIGKYDLKTR